MIRQVAPVVHPGARVRTPVAAQAPAASLDVAVLLLAACAPTALLPAGPAPRCEPLGPAVAVPAELAETSGLAASRRHPGVFWTHNDSGGEPVLYAVDANGTLLGRVRVAGATLTDWEDLALGPCPAGAGRCLYIGDIGDNAEVRDRIVIYLVPEPSPRDTVTARAQRIEVRYPDGARDAEALFVTPAGEVYIVTKGRSGPPALYRVPRGVALAPGEGQEASTVLELEAVQTLGTARPLLPDMVTGADMTPDGRRVVIRTYAALRFYRLEAGRLEPERDPPTVNLRPLEEPQGEAVAVAENGVIVLTSEAGMARGPASLATLRCHLP